MRRIALLRGINVAGKNALPMATLRELAQSLDWDQPQTYIQSGNLVFSAKGRSDELESALESAIQKHCGLSVPVLVRNASQWPGLVQGNPFPEASAAEPNRVMLCLAKRPLAKDAEQRLQERAAANERVRRVEEAIWVHYPAGSGTSKLSPALFDRAAGSQVTSRNWRTVLKLAEMLTVSR